LPVFEQGFDEVFMNKESNNVNGVSSIHWKWKFIAKLFKFATFRAESVTNDYKFSIILILSFCLEVSKNLINLIDFKLNSGYGIKIGYKNYKIKQS